MTRSIIDSDNAVERLKSDLRSHKISYTEISKPDPVNNPDKIVLKGVPPEQSSDLRSLVSDRLPEYNLSLWRRERLDGFHEAPGHGRPQESRRKPGD